MYWVALKRAELLCDLFVRSLLWEKYGLDVWKNTTLGDSDSTKKFVQFFVISDGELQMTRNDSCLLVVTSGISGQFENFCAQVFENGGQVNWCTCSYSFSIVSLSQKTVNTTDWELKPGTDGSGLCFCLGFCAFTFS